MADMNETGCPDTDETVWHETFQPIYKEGEEIRFDDRREEGAFLDVVGENHIWTQTETDDVIYYETGRLRVNAVGYLVCMVPWTTETSLVVGYRTEDGEPPQWIASLPRSNEKRTIPVSLFTDRNHGQIACSYSPHAAFAERESLVVQHHLVERASPKLQNARSTDVTRSACGRDA